MGGFKFLLQFLVTQIAPFVVNAMDQDKVSGSDRNKLKDNNKIKDSSPILDIKLMNLKTPECPFILSKRKQFLLSNSKLIPLYIIIFFGSGLEHFFVFVLICIKFTLVF